jgi:hypothetical protein
MSNGNEHTFQSFEKLLLVNLIWEQIELTIASPLQLVLSVSQLALFSSQTHSRSFVCVSRVGLAPLAASRGWPGSSALKYSPFEIPIGLWNHAGRWRAITRTPSKCLLLLGRGKYIFNTRAPVLYFRASTDTILSHPPLICHPTSPLSNQGYVSLYLRKWKKAVEYNYF